MEPKKAKVKARNQKVHVSPSSSPSASVNRLALGARTNIPPGNRCNDVRGNSHLFASTPAYAQKMSSLAKRALQRGEARLSKRQRASSSASPAATCQEEAKAPGSSNGRKQRNVQQGCRQQARGGRRQQQQQRQQAKTCPAAQAAAAEATTAGNS